MYALLWHETISLDDGYGGYYSKKILEMLEFKDLQDALNHMMYQPNIIYKLIEFKEIKTKLGVTLC